MCGENGGYLSHFCSNVDLFLLSDELSIKGTRGISTISSRMKNAKVSTLLLDKELDQGNFEAIYKILLGHKQVFDTTIFARNRNISYIDDNRT